MSSIEGIPEGWELVRVGHPVIEVDWVLNHYGDPILFSGNPNVNPGSNWPIIRKVKKPKAYRAFASAAEYKPHRDRWLARTDENGLRVNGEFRLDGFDDTGIWLGSNHLSYKDALDRGGVFDDGTPFGVEVTS